MSSRIDEAQVRRIAKLARLKLSDDEVHLFAGQLGDVLDYMKQLESIDTDGVPPLAHPLAVTNVVREDQPRASLPAEQALANAPSRHEPFFRVPKVLDQSGGA